MSATTKWEWRICYFNIDSNGPSYEGPFFSNQEAVQALCLRHVSQLFEKRPACCFMIQIELGKETEEEGILCSWLEAWPDPEKFVPPHLGFKLKRMF